MLKEAVVAKWTGSGSRRSSSAVERRRLGQIAFRSCGKRRRGDAERHKTVREADERLRRRPREGRTLHLKRRRAGGSLCCPTRPVTSWLMLLAVICPDKITKELWRMFGGMQRVASLAPFGGHIAAVAVGDTLSNSAWLPTRECAMRIWLRAVRMLRCMRYRRALVLS